MLENNIQQLIDALGDGETLKLPSNREIQGPAFIRKPVVVDGQGATLWCPKGPVLYIEADDVSLRDLNIEITGKDENLLDDETYALVIMPGCHIQCSEVNIRGKVKGLQEEEGDWQYPRSVSLRTLKPGQRHEFAMRLFIPVPCRLLSEIAGLSLAPKSVKGEGLTEIKVKLDPLLPRVLIRGSIQLKSAFLARRIAVSGNTAADPEDDSARVGAGELIYEPPVHEPPPEPKPEQQPETTDKAITGIPVHPSPSVNVPEQPGGTGEDIIAPPGRRHKRFDSASLSSVWGNAEQNNHLDPGEAEASSPSSEPAGEQDVFSKRVPGGRDKCTLDPKNSIFSRPDSADDGKPESSTPAASESEKTNVSRNPSTRRIIRTRGVGGGFGQKKNDEK